ncbi:MAG: hypothetical protein BWY64_02374 [bacterium ADurb.Bin363]|nr:MAG: hypothetical protein BWY64_02374 [bacterium ADurb.Bin363]
MSSYKTESQVLNIAFNDEKKALRIITQDGYPLDVRDASYSIISNFKAIIAATGTNQRLAVVTQTKRVIILRANRNNNGDIYYGDANINGDNSDYLSPGEIRVLYFIDPYNIYIRGIINDILYCNALA